jgi:hypothetical protein
MGWLTDLLFIFSMFARGFQQGFKRAGPQFRSFTRMQANMSYNQFSSLNQKIQMVQMSQTKLSAANLLLTNIRMNYILLNEEAELGLNALSEDLGKYNSSLILTDSDL